MFNRQSKLSKLSDASNLILCVCMASVGLYKTRNQYTRIARKSNKIWFKKVFFIIKQVARVILDSLPPMAVTNHTHVRDSKTRQKIITQWMKWKTIGSWYNLAIQFMNVINNKKDHKKPFKS